MTTNNVNNVNIGQQDTEGYFPVFIETDRGRIDGRYYHLADQKYAVIYVGGIGGGFDTPAKDLYPRLCRDLLPRGISGLRIKFRNPVDLPESVFDVLAGISFLRDFGVESLGLVGHSFGGAVVIQAGARSPPIVRTIVALSSQSFGADAAASLHGQSLLLVHGSKDEVLPPTSSLYIYQMAPEPKKVVLIEDAHHVLDEKADEVYSLVSAWILQHLR